MEVCQKVINELGTEFNSQLLRAGHKMFFEEGDVFNLSFASAQEAVIISKGSIKIYNTNEDRGEFYLYHLQEGQICVLSLIKHPFPSRFIGKAISELEILLVPVSLIKHWMMLNKSWSDYVITAYHSQIDKLLQVMDDAVFKSMDQRLEAFLHSENSTTRNGVLHISHQHIADELGSSREVISRLLKKMEKNGKLILKRNQISLIN